MQVKQVNLVHLVYLVKQVPDLVQLTNSVLQTKLGLEKIPQNSVYESHQMGSDYRKSHRIEHFERILSA